MSRYRPVMGTLGFVWDRANDLVLLVHRTNRPDQKHNGLGGKLERDEDVWTGMARELREEAGIEVVSMRLRGTVSWPGFHPDGTSVFGFVFVVDSWTGEIPERNAEGPLAWQPISALDQLPMWAGDRYFLPQTFDPQVEQFHLVIPYRDGQPLGWSGTLR